MKLLSSLFTAAFLVLAASPALAADEKKAAAKPAAKAASAAASAPAKDAKAAKAGETKKVKKGGC